MKRRHHCKSSHAKVTLAVLALCGMTAFGGSAVWAADAGQDTALVQDGIHYFSVNPEDGNRDKNYNNDGAVGTDSLAVGAGAYANGTMGATALGNDAVADGERALAVGNGSKATGLDAIAIGTGSQGEATGTNAIAIGEQSHAKGMYTTAVGSYSEATAEGAVALGQQAKSKGEISTSIGIMANGMGEGGTAGNHSTAVGAYSESSGLASVALGGFSKATEKFASALGYGSEAGLRGTAIGAASQVSAEGGTAVGLLSLASATGSVALGMSSVADREAGWQGYHPVYGQMDDSSPAWQSSLGAVSVGAGPQDQDENGRPIPQRTRQIINLAAGTEDTDAVNVAQLKKSRVELTDGTNTTVNSTNDETDGHVIYSVDVKTNGTINEGDTNIVTGDTVYNALKDVSWKAQVNGTDAKTVKKDGTLNFVNGDNIAITSNDNGDIKISTTGLASSGDLWTAQAGGTDVKAVNQKVNFVGSDHITVTGTDGQIKFEATGLADTDLTNITEGGKTVINNLAKEAVKIVDGTNTNVETVPTTDGHAEYKVNLNEDVNLGDTIYLNGSDGSISAKSGGAQLAFNNSGLTVSQAKNGLTNETRIDGATITVDGGAGNQTIINGSTARIGSVLVNGGSGTATISGLTNQTTKYDGFANGSGRAATEEQLKEVAGQAGEAIETAGKGWNLTTNGKESSKTNIKPGGTVDFSSKNDNLLISNAGADLSFSLSDNLDLTKNDSKKGSVKVGENTTLTDGLLQVGTDVSLTANALNVGNSSLTTSALMVGGLTYINSNGLNANNRVISNVAAGVLDTDAVNVGQLKSAISGSQVSIKAGDGISVAKTGNQYTINVNIEGLSNEHGTVSVSTDSDSSVVPKSTPIESEMITPAPAKRMNSLLLAEEAVVAEPENSTSTGKKMYVKYTSNAVKLITDDITDPTKVADLNDGEEIFFSGDGNITTTTELETDGKNTETIRFSLNKDVKVDSIEAKNGGQINIKSEVNMNSQKITNLADGEIAEGSTDAVNGGQLYNTNQAVIANAENINSLSHSLNKLDSRINRVGAGAAALAALHPLDFDPDDKWDFAAGYGNYRGANAAAVGLYYRPNEDTMFSVGGSFGGGENMINAGVSLKIGGGSHVSTSRVAMAKEIRDLRQALEDQAAEMAQLKAMHHLAIDPNKSMLFPDVADNHWAYEYVTKLAGNGIIEGYPDGLFKGNQMMTRYEFAAIVYRLMEKGLGHTDPEMNRLAREFSNELSYIRIDTIHQDKDGTPTVQRVRVKK